MIMSTAAVTMALLYLLSFVVAGHQPTGMNTTDKNDNIKDMGSKFRGKSAFIPFGATATKINAKNNNLVVSNSTIFLSMADRVQLVKTIKKLFVNEAQVDEAREMSTDDLFGLLKRIATNPGLLSNATGIISAARDGNTHAVANLVADLLAADRVAATSTPAAPISPKLSPVMTSSTQVITA